MIKFLTTGNRHPYRDPDLRYHCPPAMYRVGRYEITGELGRGGMGVVYRAVDTTIGH